MMGVIAAGGQAGACYSGMPGAPAAAHGVCVLEPLVLAWKLFKSCNWLPATQQRGRDRVSCELTREAKHALVVGSPSLLHGSLAANLCTCSQCALEGHFVLPQNRWSVHAKCLQAS